MTTSHPTSKTVSAEHLVRRFGPKLALDDVSLSIDSSRIHALLGPNGAGKTTLIRILAGLLSPTSGEVRVLGGASTRSRGHRQSIGLVPSGDRSFYLRISGLENLAFFARLHGYGRKQAIARSQELLERVGLTEAAKLRVGLYSHGMQKRLSVARALLTDPAVLLVDEATHDLDPVGAESVRELVRESAGRGTAVLWATQRLDEIRGLAETVTLLAEGRTRFDGATVDLMAHAAPRRHVVHLRNGTPDGRVLRQATEQALGSLAEVSVVAGSDHFVLALSDGVVLGDALAAIMARDIQVLSCRQERSEIEEAFLLLTRKDEA